MIIASKQFINFSTFTPVQFEGKNVIDIAEFDESYGIAVNGVNKVDMGAGSNTEIRIDGNPVRWEDM